LSKTAEALTCGGDAALSAIHVEIRRVRAGVADNRVFLMAR
jgi:hypothetical protein